MLRPPLQYQSLKAVLPHMDANTRFRISLSMPSIRSVENMLPLRINYLNFNSCYTTINDTSYILGTFLHYTDGITPRKMQTENSFGGVRHDFDEFGFPRTNNTVLLPGDISFQPENWNEGRNDTEGWERLIRGSLIVYEKALERLVELESKGMSVKEYLNGLKPVPRDQLSVEESRVRDTLKYFSDHLPYFIECKKLELVPFECRRNNTRPPFRCYIQLTIRKGTNKQIHRFEYNKKRFEATKYLHQVIFGSRSAPIRVGDFDLSSMSAYGGPCRLPVGFQLQANKTRVAGDMLAHKNFPLLVANWDDLDCLWIYYFLAPNAFQHPAVRASKRIVIAGVLQRDLERLIQVLRDLSNLEVSMLTTEKKFSPENHFQMIQAWLSRDRQVGASFWLRMRSDKKAREVLRLVRIRNERTGRSKRCVTIRRNDSTKVEVFYVPFKGPRKNGYDQFCKWILKIRIVKV